MNSSLLAAYAVKLKDENKKACSQSGGAFLAISDYVLKNRGVVYGVVLDEDLLAHHIRVDNYDDRNKLCKSKYIQSRLFDTFRQVRDDLGSGKIVLFSGTSCQIHGLNKYIGLHDNLITVDIICHGVPSPKIWKSYIIWQENRYRGKCIDAIFRNKTKYGWKSHVETLYIKKGNQKKQIDSSIFKTIFYGHRALRPSCYSCPYKSIVHPGDITIGDCWGAETAYRRFNDDKGVSLLLVNNHKGEEVFKHILPDVLYISVDINKLLQDPLVKPYDSPSDRSVFWQKYISKPFVSIAKEFGDYGIINTLKKGPRHTIGYILKRMGIYEFFQK